MEKQHVICSALAMMNECAYFCANVVEKYGKEYLVVKTLEQVDLEPLYTFKEAMSYLRVSRSTLWRMMRSNQLTGRKIGATWRFKREDLDRALKQPGTSEQGATA